MNILTAIEDFGYQDFILIKATPEELVPTVHGILSEDPPGIESDIWRPGPVMRVFLRVVGLKKRFEPTEEILATFDPAPFGRATEAPYLVHRGKVAEAAGEMLTIERGPLADPAAQGEPLPPFHDDVRLSVPRAAPDWTLIEFREDISGMSLLASQLSDRFGDCDVLYFRRSGDLAHDVHFDFHVYRDSAPVRRVLCHSTWPMADDAEEWWEGHADGPLSAYETKALYDGASDMDLLDDVKQQQILSYLGLSYEQLFRPEATRDAVLISRREGGAAIDRG